MEEFVKDYWSVIMGIGGLIVVIAKMHGDVAILKDKVKTLFALHNGGK